MLSDGKERVSGNFESSRVRNDRLSEQNPSRSKSFNNPTNQRIRRSSIDLSLKRPFTQIPSTFKFENSLPRSKEFLSSTAVPGAPHPNSLSLSQLNTVGTYNAHRDQDVSREKKIAQDWTKNTDIPMNRRSSWSKAETINASCVRATSLNRRNDSDAPRNYNREINGSLWDISTRETTNFARDSTTRPWDVPDTTSDDAFPHTKADRPSPIEDSIDLLAARPLSPRIQECKNIDRAHVYETSAIDTVASDKCTEELIKSAIVMLEKASQKIKKDSGEYRVRLFRFHCLTASPGCLPSRSVSFINFFTCYSNLFLY